MQKHTMLQQQIRKQQEDLRIVSEQLALLQQMEALSQVPDSAVARGTFNASELTTSSGIVSPHATAHLCNRWCPTVRPSIPCSHVGKGGF